MDFKDRYKLMNSFINPDAQTVSSTLSQMRADRKRPYWIAGAAAAACVAAVIALAASGVFAPNAPDSGMAAAVQTQTPSQTASANQSPAPASTPVSIALDGSPVPFSSLGLNLSGVDYPDMPADSTACLAPFSESLLKDTCVVITGTVQNVRFNHYFTAQITAVYEVLIDTVLYSEKDVAPGDVIVIEQDLFMATSLQDSVVGLKPGGRFLLPIYEVPEEYAYISEYIVESTGILPEAQVIGVQLDRAQTMESRYRIIYPFIPPIQAVPGVGWLFPSSWESLVTENASPVEMDEPVGQAMYGELYYGSLYLRDDSILQNIGVLIDTYTSSEYREEHTYIPPEIPIEDGYVETTENLAYLYIEQQLTPFIMLDIGHLQNGDMQRFVAQSQQPPYPILISTFEPEQNADGGWTASYKQYMPDGTLESKRIDIPAMLSIPEDSEILAAADAYVADKSLTPAVRFSKQSQCFIVEYLGADGQLRIRAELNLLGHLYRYLIFE